MHILQQTGTFIHNAINEDLKGDLTRLKTRFPPEPGGYIHIGNAKAIYINFELAKIYGGTCNLRVDDTNPVISEEHYVKALKEDINWLGYDFEGRFFCASDYFERFYNCAIELINKGAAYVCDLSPSETRAAFGTIDKPGTNSPYRDRSAEENLDLFKRMRAGEFEDGAKTLRAKIDMASPNLNMRDPIIYRITRKTHYNTGNDWCIYPMYDFSHPLEDAIEGITHSLCSIEFEDHRPLYDWFLDHLSFPDRPRQIEFAKMKVSNTIMGKRFIRKLVNDGDADGWDDPRLVTVSGMRRRGYPPAAIREFLGNTGVSKADSRVDFGMLEHFVREHLAGSKVVMVVLDPVKVVIENLTADEELDVPYVQDNPEMGSRKVPFTKEIYIEREDFLEEPASKFFRLAPGKEVRLKGAYYIKCTDVKKDADGNIIEIRCTYDPETKSGSGNEMRKVKGTIHWVSASKHIKIKAMLYDVLVLDDPESEDGVKYNPDSLVEKPQAIAESALINTGKGERFQFMRNGYFCHDINSNGLVFNRIVSLKSSYKPNKTKI